MGMARIRKTKYTERGWVATGTIDPVYFVPGSVYTMRRQNVYYSYEEKRDLLLQFIEGHSIQAIAEWHERTEGGVRTQLDRILDGIQHAIPRRM